MYCVIVSLIARPEERRAPRFLILRSAPIPKHLDGNEVRAIIVALCSTEAEFMALSDCTVKLYMFTTCFHSFHSASN